MPVINQVEKVYLEVPDTGTWVLGNTRPFLCSSIVSFWTTPACSKERKYHISRQYWYTRNVPVFTNTGTFQYLGPEVYFFPSKYFIVLLVKKKKKNQSIILQFCVLNISVLQALDKRTQIFKFHSCHNPALNLLWNFDHFTKCWISLFNFSIQQIMVKCKYLYYTCNCVWWI